MIWQCSSKLCSLFIYYTQHWCGECTKYSKYILSQANSVKAERWLEVINTRKEQKKKQASMALPAFSPFLVRVHQINSLPFPPLHLKKKRKTVLDSILWHNYSWWLRCWMYGLVNQRERSAFKRDAIDNLCCTQVASWLLMVCGLFKFFRQGLKLETGLDFSSKCRISCRKRELVECQVVKNRG